MATACAHAPLNVPLERALTQREVNRERPLPDSKSDELNIVLSFSGGGVRAAALAYGVLEGLSEAYVPGKTVTHRLLDEVNLITSVSGGSFTAAYYGLYGDRIFDDYEREFLQGRIGRSLVLALLNPWNWIRLASTHFDRTDLAAEVFDDALFHGASFGDITNHPGPLIALQATDLIEGARFGFSTHTFGLICSDISKYPVARAVAASAAVPVLFSPITLRNYARSCPYYSEPAWIAQALAEGPSAGRRYQNARHLRSYTDPGVHPWIYLVDGAVADNLGLHRVFDAVTNRGGLRELLRARGIERVHRFAFIIVNAQVPPSAQWDNRDEPPGTFEMLDAAAGAQVNRYSFESVELLRRNLQDWTKEFVDAGLERPDSYVVEVSFDQLMDETERRSFSGIPTTYDLPKEEVDRLRAVAKRLLYDSPDFQRLLRDMRGHVAQ